ncbi:FaeA/PapI family transcriptional regulator [Candidatus Woesearchaeota archaeon]|nr:FaeA/PapI family transcriptional regulator [Candidatus Woesearchaeota archaeon]
MNDKILEMVKRKGPVVPTDISSELKVQSYLVSAYLSDLLNKKQLIMSNLKLGSSGLYFLPEQKHMLEKFAEKLNEKDYRAFLELKESKVLRESTMTPLMRVSVKNIKDFAVPLEVSFNNQKEVFWKFYSVPADEASVKIKQLLTGNVPQEENKVDLGAVPTKTVVEQPKPVAQSPVKEVVEPQPRPKVEEIKKSEKVDLIEIEKLKEEISKLKEENVKIKESSKNSKKSDGKTETEEEDKTIEEFDVKKRLEECDDKFLKQIGKYLDDKDIEVLEFDIIKKNSDINIFAKIPTTIGKINFFIKSRNKKKISDSDLSAAYADGLINKMPVVFLTPGDLTKRAKEKLNLNFKNMKVVIM